MRSLPLAPLQWWCLPLQRVGHSVSIDLHGLSSQNGLWRQFGHAMSCLWPLPGSHQGCRMLKVSPLPNVWITLYLPHHHGLQSLQTILETFKHMVWAWVQIWYLKKNKFISRWAPCHSCGRRDSPMLLKIVPPTGRPLRKPIQCG